MNYPDNLVDVQEVIEKYAVNNDLFFHACVLTPYDVTVMLLIPKTLQNLPGNEVDRFAKVVERMVSSTVKR